MAERDFILAVLQSGIALAGLLLIFSGFLFSKAASFDTKRGDKYKGLAKLTLVPVLASLLLSWISIDALQGDQWAVDYLVVSLRATLALTAAFAVVGVLGGAP